MDTPQDATADPSPAPDQTVTPEPAAAPVSPAAEPDRPWQNLKGEMDRKYGRLERQLDAIATHLATLSQPRPNATDQSAVTDDDLWRLAQQGDRNAFDVYMQRVASRTADSRMGVQRQADLVERQMAAIVAKYPSFNDANHPLTQTAHQAYQLLLGQGYPQGRSTLLEAAKLAIADRPDLVAEIYSATQQAGEGARRSATQTAQAGQTPATHRAAPAQPRSTVKPVSPSEAALAARMGIKDPQKSKERFQQRQNEGRSALGSVASFVKDEDL